MSTGGRVRGTSIADALHSAATAIGAAGSDTPRLDAELLLGHALGVTRERLLIERDHEVPVGAVRGFASLVRRRAIDREPVAYIIGRRAFARIELCVDPRALIPRPETELLVELGATLPRGASVIDVGTGSGAIALALKHERPDLEVTGSDVSADALALARANARRLGLTVRFRQADLLDGAGGKFDALLCNLPYVRDTERWTLAPEIVRHEPSEALFAGPDGLEVIGALIEQAAQRRWTLLALEVGAGQAAEAMGRMRAAGLPGVDSQRDLAGIDRVVLSRRGRGDDRGDGR